MTGGLINIVSYGTKDLYLTGSPEITYWKYVYRRHTNFSLESIEINIEDELDFNKESEIEIPIIGDLIHKSYLQIKIPSISVNRSEIQSYSRSNFTTNNTFLNNFETVKNFNKFINTKAYRIINNDIDSENVTTINIVKDALLEIRNDGTNLNFTGKTIDTIISDYISLLSTTVDSNSNPIFNSTLSNIEVFLLNSEESLNNGITITKETLKSNILKIIEQSIKVQKYFYDQYNLYIKSQQDYNSNNLKFAWVEKLGHTIIDYIEVKIGGETIDKHYGIWIEIWNQLSGKYYLKDVYDKMIGNVKELTTFDRTIKSEYLLNIPLTFWFSKFNGLSFPLIALQYSELSFNIKLKSINECAYIEYVTDQSGTAIPISMNDIWENNGYKLDGKLLIDYIFLESNERRKFAQSSHEYLIETIQMNKVDISLQSNLKMKLDFRHPIKELIWIVQKKELIENNFSTKKTNSFNFSTYNSDNNKINPILKSKLEFNGYTRSDNESNYYNFYETLLKHSNSPEVGVNVYSFSLHPEQHQPSGTANISKISNAILELEFNTNTFKYKSSEIYPHIESNSSSDAENNTDIRIYVFALGYNILRIIGGFGAKGFN